MSLELDDGYLKTTDDYGQIFLAPVDEFTYADCEALGFGNE